MNKKDPVTSPGEAAHSLAALLMERQLKLVTAESCTGGGIAFHLTSIPGSSRWFERGYITYSNASKREVLAVPDRVLDSEGAVSEATAAAMAAGALAAGHADCSLAVTGIAGPDGGSGEKPVGTVCFAWSLGPDNIDTATRHFSGDRQAVREQTICYALAGIIGRLRESPR